MLPIEHLAIIMDGNGRWAKQKQRPRAYGHVQGVRVAKKIITAAREIGIPHLTLYAFSAENWKRPQQEVLILMSLLQKYIKRERKNLLKNNIKFQVIGQIERLPKEIVHQLQDVMNESANNTGMVLTMALSYGGREDILGAIKKILQLNQDEKIDLNQITPEYLSQLLDTHGQPDPDLIIRTSGEKRLSNFFLWQSAYSEFYFTEKHWPEFTKTDLLQALQEFSKRERRFGKTSEQIQTK